VLVADDERDVTEQLGAWLDEQGFEVTCVHDGREALALLAGQDFDRVFLDIMMPYLDGYQVLEWARQQERLQGLWIALMMHWPPAEEVWASLPYQPDQWVVKPFDPSSLWPKGLPGKGSPDGAIGQGSFAAWAVGSGECRS
jgi:DNA-binding response OmpR family regulator